VVWVCKYRRRILKPGVIASLERMLPTMLDAFPGASLERIGFDRDHLHMVMLIPPKYAISDVMRSLKSRSYSALRAEFPWIVNASRGRKKVVWSPGFYVSSVGANKATIAKYVADQGKRDSGQEKLDL
jgi:putative transposase